MIIRGKQKNWQVVIGLEVHAQMNTKYKLFSPMSKTIFGEECNSQVSFIDVALPGTLPRLNSECVDMAVKTGLAISARINEKSIFDRKNYFYSDLPQGYQITQMYHPIINDGKVEIELENGITKIIKVDRIHIEQDAGKNIHDESLDHTLIDLNRAGIGLMEIVTEPSMRAPEEAGAFLRSLRIIMRYIGSCDGNMEEGSMRCDANVSVMPDSSNFLGTRVELKNLNSIKNVMRAIEIESHRQVEILESGGIVKQETRLFDPDKQITKSMRNKEDLADYRYFSDPNLIPIILTQDYIEKIRQTLPEMPKDKINRYIKDFCITIDQAKIIANDKNNAIFFEKMVYHGAQPKNAANWMISELFSYIKDIDTSPVSAENLADLVILIDKGNISGKIAKTILEKMFIECKSANEIIALENLSQINNKDDIIKIIKDVILNHPKEVDDYRSGRVKLFGFFVGQIMQRSKGMANPTLVNDLLKIELK
ncbi:Asp-tRNA(Asn)/Glu-tRNA(Gln) amidotransferase subunit GatB [Lyticum sinuosum]|uniref:Aspartyl/glutamyl-tRNA(Asn/Gln) amidotransferase subunit B n=1 Tax=Lyticum sinuosum TaxID=1332059 RepID=A0AAE5AHF9_9RICK|nr:Asp-tRNA(Asn)/Glu-tRNA(Gln) amidotransferase subunit GatB [Lyticum sinuosum]MDZ5760981.1 Aspartyl/glutamyl-tRNA(Asn/Gln) amidotransferase subunit B [Lyticum sinuosum]